MTPGLGHINYPMNDLRRDELEGIPNAAFVYDEDSKGRGVKKEDGTPEATPEQPIEEVKERDTWGNPIEFLMSCISLSVGLGNIWRFPFTAYENGGGAFLIPYLVVLLLIGKPLYFLEMALGQFSSSGSVKAWSLAPIAKGVGYSGALATWFVVTYYCCLMALTVFYFFSSFQSVLPWTYCDPAWARDGCYNSSGSAANASFLNSSTVSSSAQQFFTHNVLNQASNIDDGIGIPDWRLALCLLLSWIIICLILIKGVASSGKAAYFTALFPYAVLITLLVRGVTLPGAVDGILFFITPQWDKILDVQVWYAAVAQCFFSLSVAFGPIIMNASYNRFRHTIYRDATIVSFMDTFTSMLAGITIFSILGNLAYETGKPIDKVVQGGTGLAFVSYPEALAKFDFVPQLFAVLFFMMLFTLGVGSEVSLAGGVITVICDAFPKLKRWMVTVAICVAGFLFGLIYITPGGLYVLDVVDFFGGGFIIFVAAVFQTIAISWIYGLKNFLRDIEFMLGIRLGIYWKFTWGIFIPVSLSAIFVYSLVSFRTFEANGYVYPAALTGAGWVLAVAALIQIPAWAVYSLLRGNSGSLVQRFKNSMKPTEEWGPKDTRERIKWCMFKQDEPLNHASWTWWLPKLVKKVFQIDGHSLSSPASTATIVMAEETQTSGKRST